MKELINKLFAVEEVTSQEIIEASIKKYGVQYLCICILISLFEIFMFGRGLMYFDLSKINRRIYMTCYACLFLASVSCGIQLVLSIKNNNVPSLLKKSFYFYCIYLTIWSACISVLDILGGHMPLVYMTVIMGTAALAFIRPIVYYACITPLSILIGYFTSAYGKYEASKSGFIINFIVFIITFFIIYRQYFQNIQDYILVNDLQYLSHHDQLTGIYNRLALNNHLKQVSDKNYFGIFDLDNFKKINDNYGNDFGDECLKKVAKLLKENYGDMTYRYGGDEFVCVSPFKKAELKKKGKIINTELAKAFPDKNISISGGFYLLSGKTNDYQEYLKKADEALYIAKKTRKEKFIIFE